MNFRKKKKRMKGRAISSRQDFIGIRWEERETEK